MNRGEKQQEIDELTGHFQKSKIAVCAEYRGLTVAQVNTFRKNLRDGNSFGRVAKNSLLKLSLKKAYKDQTEGIQKFSDLLDGPNLVVFSYQDPVSPAKVIAKFKKDNEKLKIKGAIVDGKFLDPNGIEEYSKLPSREEILAKLLCLLNTPATQLLRVMKASAEQVVRVIDAHRANLEKKG